MSRFDVSDLSTAQLELCWQNLCANPAAPQPDDPTPEMIAEQTAYFRRMRAGRGSNPHSPFPPVEFHDPSNEVDALASTADDSDLVHALMQWEPPSVDDLLLETDDDDPLDDDDADYVRSLSLPRTGAPKCVSPKSAFAA